MARGQGIKHYYNFTRGWNTEASPMTFPEGTARDIDNVIIDIDGSIRRRGGINFDTLGASFANTSTTSDFNTNAIASFEWLNVSGEGSLSFTVTQFGTDLYFHQQAGEDTSNNLIGSVDFSSFALNITEAEKSVVAVDNGLGYLFVVGKYIEPFYIEYDVVSETLTATQIDIKIRDFDGVDDGLEISERPTTLSDAHHYNLLNQGWVNEGYAMSLENRGSSTINVVTIGNPIQSTFDEEQLGFYPSNADIMYLCKTTVGDSPDVIGAYRPFILENLALGNTRAPRGHFILDAFNKDRFTASGINVANDSISNRPNAVAFHNGRVFYSGLTATGRTGEVYFSQQLVNIDRVGLCYQDQDPTAEDLNALVATDGGVIPIPDCGVVLAMEEGRNGIVVFASNGVWEISGVDGRFSADSFFVRKVTNTGCIAPESVINADGTLMFWSDAGIIALGADKISEALNDENITKNTIQTKYLQIGGVQRKFSRGVYITEEKKAVWLYSTEELYDGVTDRFKYNGVLVLDMQLGAFYKYSVTDYNVDSVPYIAAITKVSPFKSEIVLDEVVTSSGDPVTTSTGDPVVVNKAGFSSEYSRSSWNLLCVRVQYGTTSTWGLTFGDFNSRSFTDWYLQDGVGVDYSSYIETGFELQGNPIVDKKPTYVNTFFSPKSKSLNPGSYYEFPPLPDFTSGITCDIQTLTPDGDELDVLSAICSAHYLSEDGTRLLAANVFDSLVGHAMTYVLSTPYELATAVEDANTLTCLRSPGGAFINPDRDLVFILGVPQGSSVARIETYQLTTPWDLGSATLIRNFIFPGGTYLGLHFSPDGKKMYVGNSIGILQYELATAWDTSSATLVYTFPTGAGGCRGLAMQAGGNEAYFVDRNNRDLNTIMLTTPYDFTTATITDTLATTLQGDITVNGSAGYIYDGTLTATGLRRLALTCSAA